MMGGMAQMMAQMRGMGGMGSGMGGGEMGGYAGMGRMYGRQQMDMMGPMGMMGGGGVADAEAKKRIKYLTRTDFLIQFVWQPPKVEEMPKTDEERETKIKEEITKLTEAEKNSPAVRTSKDEIEKELEAASRKKSQQLDSAVSKVIGGMNAATVPTAAPGAAAAVPGGSAVPGAQPGAAPNPAAAPPPR
jgi:type IV pilus assembly protein PilM